MKLLSNPTTIRQLLVQLLVRWGFFKKLGNVFTKHQFSFLSFHNSIINLLELKVKTTISQVNLIYAEL